MKTNSKYFRLTRAFALAGASWLLGLAVPCALADEPMPFPPAVDADHTPPKLLQRVEPTWPAELRDETSEQRIYVSFIVDRTGKVKNASAMFTPRAPFAKAAVEAVQQWTFEPGFLRGRARARSTRNRGGSYAAVAERETSK